MPRRSSAKRIDGGASGAQQTNRGLRACSPHALFLPMTPCIRFSRSPRRCSPGLCRRHHQGLCCRSHAVPRSGRPIRRAQPCRSTSFSCRQTMITTTIPDLPDAMLPPDRQPIGRGPSTPRSPPTNLLPPPRKQPGRPHRRPRMRRARAKNATSAQRTRRCAAAIDTTSATTSIATDTITGISRRAHNSARLVRDRAAGFHPTLQGEGRRLRAGVGWAARKSLGFSPHPPARKPRCLSLAGLAGENAPPPQAGPMR